MQGPELALVAVTSGWDSSWDRIAHRSDGDPNVSESENPATSPTPEPTKHWSDRKADTVGVLVIFAAVVLAALHFISGGLSS